LKWLYEPYDYVVIGEWNIARDKEVNTVLLQK
jgi:hypothetical protein